MKREEIIPEYKPVITPDFHRQLNKMLNNLIECLNNSGINWEVNKEKHKDKNRRRYETKAMKLVIKLKSIMDDIAYRDYYGDFPDESIGEWYYGKGIRNKQ